MKKATNQISDSLASIDRGKEEFWILEGVYIISPKLLFMCKPIIELGYSKKKKRVKGKIKFLGRSKKIRMVEHRDSRFVFALKFDIFIVDLVVDFYKNDAFIGFVDTPLGNYKFTGRYLTSRYGE